MKFSKRPVPAIIAAGMLTMSTAGIAHAAGPDSDSSVDITPNESYVVVDPAQSQRTATGEIFYPTGEIDDDTLVIIPDADGTLGGMDVKELTDILDAGGPEALRTVLDEPAQTAKNGSSFETEAPGDYAPFASVLTWAAAPMSYSPFYTHPTQHWGTTESAKVTYSYFVNSTSNQQACAWGKGYYRGYNGSEYGEFSKMYGIGCASGSGGNTSTSVPWGNVAANPTFRAKSTTIHMANGGWKF